MARIVTLTGMATDPRPGSYWLNSGIGDASNRAVVGGKHVQGAGETERDQRDRDDPEPLLARRRKPTWGVEG